MTQTDLINLALAELGEESISTTADTSDRARHMVRVWESALRTVINAFPWGWAKTIATLEVISPTPAFGWANGFTLPTDFVRLVSLNELDAWTPSDVFELQSGVLYTDESEAKIEYLFYPTASGLDTFLDRMDPGAEEILVLRLARLAAPLVVKDGLEKAKDLEMLYMRALSRTRTIAANQQKPAKREPGTESNVLRARYGDLQD